MGLRLLLPMRVLLSCSQGSCLSIWHVATWGEIGIVCACCASNSQSGHCGYAFAWLIHAPLMCRLMEAWHLQYLANMLGTPRHNSFGCACTEGARCVGNKPH